MKYKVKDWHKFQHYKERRPIWIKLHRTILDDCAFLRLQVASRALAPLIWLLASESDDGTISGCHDELSFRLRLKKEEIEDGINGLLSIGYISRYQCDSDTLADCYQPAIIETERETEKEREKEREQRGRALSFDSIQSIAKAIKGARKEFAALRDMTLEGIVASCHESVREKTFRDFVENTANMIECPKDPVGLLKGYVRKAMENIHPPEDDTIEAKRARLERKFA